MWNSLAWRLWKRSSPSMLWGRQHRVLCDWSTMTLVCAQCTRDELLQRSFLCLQTWDRVPFRLCRAKVLSVGRHTSADVAEMRVLCSPSRAPWHHSHREDRGVSTNQGPLVLWLRRCQAWFVKELGLLLCCQSGLPGEFLPLVAWRIPLSWCTCWCSEVFSRIQKLSAGHVSEPGIQPLPIYCLSF